MEGDGRRQCKGLHSLNFYASTVVQTQNRITLVTLRLLYLVLNRDAALMCLNTKDTHGDLPTHAALCSQVQVQIMHHAPLPKHPPKVVQIQCKHTATSIFGW